MYEVGDGYTMNLLIESVLNGAAQAGKAKDATRVMMLTKFVRDAGVENPRDIL